MMDKLPSTKTKRPVFVFVHYHASRLNEQEQQISIQPFFGSSQNFKKDEILTIEFILELHKKMLGDVWLWAGSFRKTEKSIGIKWVDVQVELKSFWTMQVSGSIRILIRPAKLPSDASIVLFQFIAFRMETVAIQGCRQTSSLDSFLNGLLFPGSNHRLDYRMKYEKNISNLLKSRPGQT